MEKTQLKNILTKIGEVNPKYNLEKQVYNVGELIQFIDNPSETVQLAAVEEYPFSIKYIKNPSERVQLAAVEENGRAIKLIQNPTERVQLAVVKQYTWAIRFIQNPTEKVKQLARLKGYDI